METIHKESKRPNIFVVDQAIELFDNAISKLKKIEVHINDYLSIDGVLAAYLYGYSIYEGTLYQLYKMVARAFPDRIDIELKKSYHEIILESGRMSTLRDIICDDFSRQFGHNDFKHLIKQLGNIIAIKFDLASFPTDEMSQYKNNRDKLAHRGCFDFRMQQNEMLSHINAVISVLELIKEKFNYAYSKYTYEFLIRESCRYVLGMEDAIFNMCFYFDDGKFRVHKKGVESWYGFACSSERHRFLLFMANHGLDFSKDFNIDHLRPTCSLDNTSLNKVSYINDLFRAYPHLINMV